MPVNPANKPASLSTVKEYLLAAYQVDEATVNTVLTDPEVQRVIYDGQNIRSHAYYVGEEIAQSRGWDENPEYDPDEEDEDEDD